MQPLIIGITGGSGSGKTSFIRLIRERFAAQDLCVISQDDYYRARADQELDEQGVVNFDLPKAIFKNEFIRDVKQLRKGQAVTRQEYTFNNERAQARTLVFLPAPIIIVEGLFVFHFKKMRKLIDLRIYLHAKENLKVIRRIRRDQVDRNYPLDDVLYRYENHVLPAFERYIKPYIEEADLIVNNNQHFNMGLEVVCGYLDNYLRAHHAAHPTTD